MSFHNNQNDNGCNGSSGNAINTAESKIKMVIDKPNQFPWKLYDMLETAEKRGEEYVISWIREGTAFKVHNREVFIEEYMKKQFNQTKFKSFQRQRKFSLFRCLLTSATTRYLRSSLTLVLLYSESLGVRKDPNWSR
jgi:hypothetical protein